MTTTKKPPFFYTTTPNIFALTRKRDALKPITTKQAYTILIDGIAIISIMFLIEYLCQELWERKYSGLFFPAIIIIWLTICYHEIKEEKNKNGNPKQNRKKNH